MVTTSVRKDEEVVYGLYMRDLPICLPKQFDIPRISNKRIRYITKVNDRANDVINHFPSVHGHMA